MAHGAMSPGSWEASDQPSGEGRKAGLLSGRRLMLVDDNEQNLELLAAYLEDLGAELRLVARAETVVDEVASWRPHLIVLDVMMPRISGFQICERLKKSALTASIPILVVTALDQTADRERAREVGADAFLTKPVGKTELIDHVRGLLATGSR